MEVAEIKEERGRGGGAGHVWARDTDAHRLPHAYCLHANDPVGNSKVNDILVICLFFLILFLFLFND